MIYAIPFIGHIVGFIGFTSLAFPFWLFWTVFGMGEKYFYFVPPIYYEIGFWESFMVFSLVSILKSFIPGFISRKNELSQKIKELSESIGKIIKDK